MPIFRLIKKFTLIWINTVLSVSTLFYFEFKPLCKLSILQKTWSVKKQSQKAQKEQLESCSFLNLVPRVGLEPTHLAAGDFESPASTNFATWAGEEVANYIEIIFLVKSRAPFFWQHLSKHMKFIDINSKDFLTIRMPAWKTAGFARVCCGRLGRPALFSILIKKR